MVLSTSGFEKFRYALISEFAISLSEAAGLDALKEDAIPKLKYIMDFTRCTLALLNEDESSYRLLTLLETSQEMLRTTEETLPLESGIHGNVIRNGEPCICGDLPWVSVKGVPVADPSIEGGSLNSNMCLPLQVGGKTFGSIAFATNQEVGYTRADINMASTIATHLSLAIDRWNLIQKLSATNEEVQKLNTELEERVEGRTADLRKEINERKRTESALRESEARFRTLVQHAPEAIVVLDADTGRFVEANENAVKLYGLEKESLLEVDPAQMSPPTQPDGRTSQDAAGEKVQEALSGDTPVFEWMHRNAAGRDIPCEVRLVRLQAAGRNLVRGSVTDISERKQAEEAVQRYTKRLETLREIDRAILAARSPEAIAQAAMGHIRELVPCLRATVGIFDFEAGESIVQAIHARGETRLGLGARFPLEAFGIDELRHGNVSIVADVKSLPNRPIFKALKAEGLRSWINVPLIAQGELIGALSVASKDVSAFSTEDVDIAREVADSLAIAMRQAQLHERVQRQAAELEQRVAERTAELEAFSYSVSHDLRAPVRAIDGFSRVLLKDYGDKLDDECSRLLNIICSNTRNMGRLIDDLLAFSRLGRQEMNLTDINMGELAKSVFDQLKSTIPERALHLNIGVLPSAQGDPAMIRQIFVNLLSNAIKFTRSKKPAVVDIGYKVEDDQGIYHVRDNGVGFDMQYAHKLFGVFQRLHTADEFEGTGVGLAIVHTIIQRHGGRVWADGKIDEGATIYFTL